MSCNFSTNLQRYDLLERSNEGLFCITADVTKLIKKLANCGNCKHSTQGTVATCTHPEQSTCWIIEPKSLWEMKE